MEMDDINIPPAQDSPKNILNILIDDCLQSVLLKIDNVWDFYNAAKVCTRFQNNAKICFPFKRVDFQYDYELDRYHSEPFYDYIRRRINIMSFNDAESFLSIFASKIKFIHCKLSSYPQRNVLDHENNLNLIAKYCGKTLPELFILDDIRDNEKYNLRTPFQALKELILYTDRINHFNPAVIFPELEVLHTRYIRRLLRGLPVKKFPQLKHVHFGRRLRNDIFIEFQNDNPQLQSLFTCFGLNSSWEGISDRLPNIISLRLSNILLTHTPTPELMRNISKLRHLKILHIYGHGKKDLTLIKSLLSSSINNNQPIEELGIKCIDIELGGMLMNMPKLKKLFIYKISDEIAISLAKNLPALEYMRLDGPSLSAVRRILMNVDKIAELNIYTKKTLPELDFNLNLFNSIVALAKGRTKVTIFFEPVLRIRNVRGDRVWIPNPVEKDILSQISTNKNEWVHFEYKNYYD